MGEVKPTRNGFRVLLISPHDNTRIDMNQRIKLEICYYVGVIVGAIKLLQRVRGQLDNIE